MGGSFLMTENPAVTADLEKVYVKAFSRRAADVGAAPAMHVTSTVKRAWCRSGHSPPSHRSWRVGSSFDLLSTTTTNNVLPMTHVGL
ncbi:hypothetical protein MJ561_13970 [Klebsiella pneumoniae]|nr:hypothetical protein MJ561_13970 [Klebsiella pneumoniae]